MPVSLVFVLISVTALWLLGHQRVKRRLAKLQINLPDTYQSAFTVPTNDEQPQKLAALCVDLMRKEHRDVPFDDLTPQEKKMVLHAQAIDVLPAWMSRYAALSLSKPNRVLIGQLRHIKSSRPDRPKQHFGAIKRQQQLRSPSES